MDSWEKQLRYLLQSLDAIRDAILELKPTPPPGSSLEGLDLTKPGADKTKDFGGDYGRGWYDGRAQGFKDAQAIIQTEAGKDKPCKLKITPITAASCRRKMAL